MIGTTVAGRYQIEEQIGIGGMGIVYRARDARLRREVALKVIAPHLMQQEAARSRFLREAQALAGLTHPNIVTIFDLAEDEAAHTVFLVMELLSGNSLRHYLEADSDLFGMSRPPFSQIALPLCRALEAAHGRGILHRDIKPENIFVCTDGTLKLMDFGLARLLGDMSKNQSSTVAGTLAYMAPEQLRGETLDARADLYALGIVFYEYLAGQQPFRADNPGALLLKHLTEPPPHLRDTLPALPQEMDALLIQMLAKEPTERFATAGEIREILERPLLNVGTLADAVDQTAPGRRTAGTGGKIAGETMRQYPLSATLPGMQTLLPTQPAVQAAVQAPSTIQHSKSGPIRSRTAAAAMASAGVLAALLVGKTLLSKAGTPASGQTKAQPAGVIPVMQKAPLAALKVTPPAGAASASHLEAGTGLLTTKAAPELPSSTSGSLPTPNTYPAPNNSLKTSALTAQQLAELESLRREQQEELALLRNLRRQMAEKSVPSSHMPAEPSLARPGDASSKSLSLAPTKPVVVTPHTPSEAGLGSTISAVGKSSSGGQSATGTSQYEERLPFPVLRLRAWRLPAPDDSKALHVALRNSADCNAYFYIIEDDKHRAVRAYPGPERFLAPQSQTPNDVRLPFSGDTSPGHQKAVLMIAASREITGLPATLTLPATLSDKPPTGATPQQIRAFFGQAMRRFDEEIGQQLQQNHARFDGQSLHPQDILVRVVGFNTGRGMGLRNRRPDRVSGSSPERVGNP